MSLSNSYSGLVKVSSACDVEKGMLSTNLVFAEQEYSHSGKFYIGTLLQG
jgi:hypothetical protein